MWVFESSSILSMSFGTFLPTKALRSKPLHQNWSAQWPMAHSLLSEIARENVSSQCVFFGWFLRLAPKAAATHQVWAHHPWCSWQTSCNIVRASHWCPIVVFGFSAACEEIIGNSRLCHLLVWQQLVSRWLFSKSQWLGMHFEVCPLIHRAMRERSADMKRKGAQIVGAMVLLIKD